MRILCLPLDPEFFKERLRAVLEVENPPVVLTQSPLLDHRLAVTEENCVPSKEKGHVSVSFSRLLAWGEPRGSN